jgi:hypothetical protein
MAGGTRRELPSEAAQLFRPEAPAPRGDRLDGTEAGPWPELPEPGHSRIHGAAPRFWPDLPEAGPRAAPGADELDIEAPLSAQERRRRIDREHRGA